ncbi:MAG: hypothetical protein MUF18_12215 [Fimbriiglobus sp.]|nr:hypothetical protein [Fimbriiglobus sp.]
MFTPAQVVAVCFAVLFCLAPASFYLCWLSSVNRREKPTVVAGAWDFAAVLGAVSGFLIVGGVLLLSVASSDGRLFTGGNIDRLKIVFEEQWRNWLMMLVGYVTLLGLAVTFGIKGRARWLAVYNLDADNAGRMIAAALERSGLDAQRKGNLWREPGGNGHRLVEAVTFHGTAHTTIRLLCPHERQREEIERHLRGELEAAETGPGPAASWFTSVAVGSVLLVVGCVGLIAFFTFFGR